MACDLKILDSAQAEITDIVAYLNSFSSSDGNGPAKAFVDELEASLDIACRFPEMHALSRIPEIANLGFRSLTVKDYIVLYTVVGNDLIVAHVFHQRRDYGRLV